MNRIYADNAATTKMSDTAVQAMTEDCGHVGQSVESAHDGAGGEAGTGGCAGDVCEIPARESGGDLLHVGRQRIGQPGTAHSGRERSEEGQEPRGDDGV